MKKKWVQSADSGDVIHVDGFPWKLQVIGPHAVKLVDEETGEVWEVEPNQLLAMDIDLYPDAEEDDTSARMEAFQALDAESKYHLEEIASHLNQIMTGKRYWPGESPDSVEVNPKYGPGVTRTQRIKRKVAELENSHLNYKERTWWKFLGVYELDDASTLASFKSPGRPSQVDPKYAAALEAALDHYLSNGPMPDLREVLDLAVQYIEEAPDYKGAKVPSLATQYRLLRDRRRRLGIFGSNWKYAQSRAARPKASHIRPQAHMPGERLQMDTTRANVLVRDYFGNEYRPEITLVNDPVTRMIYALIVSRSTGEKEIAALMLQLFTPKPDAPPLSPEAHYNLLGRNARHLLKYLEDGGELGPATGMIVVPRVVVIDRGRAYDNAWLRKLAAVMGFSIELSRPRTPTDKPHVERAIRTLNPILAKLPGYVGRNTVERGRGKAYRHEELLTMAELETLLKAWAHHVYHHRPHKGLVLVEGRHEGIPVSVPGA